MAVAPAICSDNGAMPDPVTIPRDTDDPDRRRMRRLQLRLGRMWDATHDTRPFAHSAVIVPSLSLDQDELAKVSGVSFYEERLLFSLIRLRNPKARVLYLTSQPVHPEIIDYYLQLLVGVPARHARRRLAMMCVYDASPRPLTEKILERPRVVGRIREWITDARRAYMTCFNSTDLERQLALELGIPLNGVDPDLLHLGTKSGSRRVFREAGIPLPEGYEDLESPTEVARHLGLLKHQNRSLKKAVVKLNASFSGEGNAVFTYPSDERALADLAEGNAGVLEANLQYGAPRDTYSRYFGKFAEIGGIVEEFLVAERVTSPSTQMRITPNGEVQVISTHEQVLGGSTGQSYEGCLFPADEIYRKELHDYGTAVGRVLQRHGVISRFAVDFVCARTAEGSWRTAAIEINLRMGGTTFPFVALQFLTAGHLDAERGTFASQRGTEKFYFATDSLKSQHYRGLLPEDLMDVMIGSGLYFNPGTETGVLFHMIGALSEFGKLGIVCIGDSPAQARELFERTRELLDGETGALGRRRRRRAVDAQSPAVRLE